MRIPFLAGYLFREVDVLTSEGIHTLSSSKRNRPGRILVIDSDISFYKVIDLPVGASVTPEFIELNFIHLSPFPNPGFCFIRVKQKLLLWFYPAQQDSYPIVVPEGYLISQGAQKVSNGVVVAQTSLQNGKFFVFIDGLLVSQFVKAVFQDGSLEVPSIVEALRKQYDAELPEVLTLDDSFLEAGFRSLSILDLLRFARIELKYGPLLQTLTRNLQTPLILFLSCYIAVSYVEYWAAKNKISALRAETASLHSSNQPLREQIDKVRKYQELWEKFYSKECAAPNPLDVMQEIAGVVADKSGTISQIRFNDDRVTIMLYSQNTSAVIDDLVKTGYFERLSLNGSITKDSKSGKEMANIEGILKKRLVE